MYILLYSALSFSFYVSLQYGKELTDSISLVYVWKVEYFQKSVSFIFVVIYHKLIV